MLRVLITDNDIQQGEPLKKSFLDNGFDVIAHMEDDAHLASQCAELAPDVVVINTESPSQDLLDRLNTITSTHARPMVMFAKDTTTAIVKAATQAGISAYVAGDIRSERLKPIIEAAIARFEETQKLRGELNQATTKLDERKIIERAKGILMQQRNLNEDSAYSMLRTMAMKKNMKLADLSSQLIGTAEMLIV